MVVVCLSGLSFIKPPYLYGGCVTPFKKTSKSVKEQFGQNGLLKLLVDM